MMKSKGILALCLASLLSAPVVAQDKPQEKKPAAHGQHEGHSHGHGMGGPEMEAMMKAMSPGEEHKRLARMTGDWTFTNQMWMAPGQPPMEGTGTMHAETILGGRYVHSVWKGTFMGQPFEGHGTDGYDNLAKKHVSAWVDNMGTGILYSTGTCDAAGKVCTTTGDMIDPMSGQTTTLRQVSTWLDGNSFKLEMFGKGPDGKEMKVMEMAVKRK